jgi:tetratricopeptide (TPR) repeat protein
MVQELNRDAIADPQVRLHLANLNGILAIVRGMVPGSSSLGDPQAALNYATEAIRLLQDPSMEDLSRQTWTQSMVRAHMAAGYNLHALGQFEEAQAQFERARDLTTTSSQTGGADLDPLDPLAISCRIALGRVLRDMGHHQLALDEHFLPAYAAIHKRAGSTESGAFAMDELLSVCLNLGDTYWWLGRPRDALPFSEEGLRLSQTLARDQPMSARAMAFAPVARAQVGKVLMAMDDVRRAESMLAESLQTAERLAAMDPANAGMQWVLCYIHGSHALAYAAWAADETAPVPERRQRIDRARSAMARAWRHLDALPSESARILPRHGLRSAETRVAEARARLEDLTKSAEQ